MVALGQRLVRVLDGPLVCSASDTCDKFDRRPLFGWPFLAKCTIVAGELAYILLIGARSLVPRVLVVISVSLVFVESVLSVQYAPLSFPEGKGIPHLGHLCQLYFPVSYEPPEQVNDSIN